VLLAESTVEQRVIEQLRSYNTIVGRIKILEKYPLGNGMHLTEPYNEDDKLQALHRQLRGLPSYMYLTKREQKLESVANAYLTRHPAGIKSQHYTVKQIRGVDDEDRKLIKELASKIRKVMDTRHGALDEFEAALRRVSELQDLQQEKDMIDSVLNTMVEYKPHYRNLLVYRYIEDKPVDIVSRELNIHRSTFDKWRKAAINEYANLSGME
jgi:hypothetical protein